MHKAGGRKIIFFPDLKKKKSKEVKANHFNPPLSKKNHVILQTFYVVPLSGWL